MFDFEELDEADARKYEEQRCELDVPQLDKCTTSKMKVAAPVKPEIQDLTLTKDDMTASRMPLAAVSAELPSILQVQFATMGSGVAVEMQLPQDVTAAEVKSMLLMHLKLPVAEQRLILGLTVWEDACTLGSVYSVAEADGHGTAQVMVVRIPIAANVALSGSRTGILRVWDIESSNLLREFNGHKGSVNCVAMHWASQRALSGGEDKIVRTWDLTQGKAIQELKGHGGAVNCLATSWDQGYAVSGSNDNTLRVWHLEKGKCKRKLSGHSGPVTCVDLDEVGWKGISGSEDRSLLVWDLSTGDIVQRCHGHVSPVNCISLDHDAKSAASGGWGTLKMWKLGARVVPVINPMTIHLGNRGDDGFNYADLKGSYGPVTCVSIDWSTRRGLSGSADTILYLWSPDQRTTAGFRLRPKALHKHTLPITCLAVDWSTAFAVSGGGDCLWVWDLNQTRTVHALRGPEERGEVLCVAMDKR